VDEKIQQIRQLENDMYQPSLWDDTSFIYKSTFVFQEKNRIVDSIYFH
jgi:hypothetical protein